MRPVPVVMVQEDTEDPLKVLLVQNQQPVETFRADGAHEPFRDAVGLWRAKRRSHDRDPVAAEHLVKALGELLIAIANQKLNGFRALGFGVHPTMCTRRLLNSMKNRT